MTTTASVGEQLCNRIDAMIAEKSLLKHPFYQRWQAGELTIDELKGYARQYYHHVLAFPRYVSGTHAQCEDLADRQELLENLREEEEGAGNHPDMWIKFGEALGLTREDMTDAELLPETQVLHETYTRVSKDSGFMAGIASLYAYEAQVPEVAGTKLDGLKQYYGIKSPDGLRFFVVHHSLDVEHSKTTREMVKRYADENPELEAEATAAVEDSTQALWGFLDGVYREYVQAAA